MSFRNIFSCNRNLYQRLFSRSHENRRIIDDVIVFPIQNAAFTSEISNDDNFQNVENLVDFIEEPSIKSFLQDQTKVLVLKIKTSDKLSSIDLALMNRICTVNSVVICLLTNEGQKFFIYWKSKNIKHFLVLKNYDHLHFMNDIKLFEFLTDFLRESLRRGHIGVTSKAVGTAIDIDSLADERGLNLLLISAEIGYVHIVEIMLALCLPSECQGVNAQTLAWKNRHFEVLSILLKSNLIYPFPIYIDECSDDIKDFYNISHELNEAILSKDESKVLSILSQNSNMTYFYNLNNESALAFALKHRLFNIYKLLISKNLNFGPHEFFNDIKEDMKESELKKLREIHYEESKFLPGNHMHVLLSNSRLGHDDTSDAEMKYECIRNAFAILNVNPFIQIILKIVAASRNFNIIFDFNRDSVEVVDPTVDGGTDGLFYMFGRIYVGAKKLLDHNDKYEALGVMAHELCHYAMLLVYKNSAKPYFKKDSNTKHAFKKISTFCQENASKEGLINLVYNAYPLCFHHAELIVRVPHLMMKYLNDPNEFTKVKATFHELFEIYEDRIYKEMKDALPRIEAEVISEKEKNRRKKKKIIKYVLIAIAFVISAALGIGYIIIKYYKPNYKFADLDHEQQKRVINAPVIYKHVDIALYDLFPLNSSAYYLLTSDDISQIFEDIPLDFSNPHLSYLNNLVIFQWKNLTTKLKNKFLASNFTFQNESLAFETVYMSIPNAFNSLKSKEIISVLDGFSLTIHKMIRNETAFYTERSMFTEYIYPIYYMFMVEHNGHKTQTDCVYKNVTGSVSRKFAKFYNNYINQKFDRIMKETNTIARSQYYRRCFSSGFKIVNPKTMKTVDSLLSYKGFQKGYDEILVQSGFKSNSSKIFLFSADAGTGKTETFRQFTLRIKRMYPDRWVSYIDYRQYKELAMKIKSLDDAKRALFRILEINQENIFEKRMFEEFFGSGRMILLWDGYEQIFSDSMSSLSLLQMINNHTTNFQFVSTRPSQSDKLRRAFRIEPYTFVPFNEDSKNNFLYGFFNSQHIDELHIPTYIDKVQRIVESTKSKDDFNTPLLLGMIAYMISIDTNIYKSENLYQIYQRFVEKKLEIWLDNLNDGKTLIETLLLYGISIPEFYQKFALRMISDSNLRMFSRVASLKLSMTSRNFPKKIKLSQISSMGILHFTGPKSYTFAHSTFVEFFVAQYLVRNIFKTDAVPSMEEADMRIQTFFWCMQDSGVVRFIESYYDTVIKNTSRNIDPEISNMFQTKYNNFFIKILQSRFVPTSALIKFFQRDHQLLTNQLQINNGTDGIYPATFNYASFNYLGYDAINRSVLNESAKIYLTADEYQKFISLKDYKGIIFYSMYCIKQSQNSSEHAREYFPDYDLPDVIFESNNVSEVLTFIARNVTPNELKKLLTSETVWYILNIYNDTNGTIYHKENDLEFFKTLLNLVQKNLTENEQKQWMSKILKYPFLLENEATRQTILFEVNKLLSSQIYEIFSTLNILHYTITIDSVENYFGRFEYSWNYLFNNSNKEQQKMILSRSVDIECYINQMYLNLCYLVPKINLLQASLLQNIGLNENTTSSLKSFNIMTNIYEKYFNVSELQELIITGSKEFIPFLIIIKGPTECKAYADFLKNLFKGSELIRTFLLEPVEPTKLTIFDLLLDLYDTRSNSEIFKRLLNTTSLMEFN